MSTQGNNHLVKDVMLKNSQFPIVKQNALIKETIDQMNNFHLGVACIVSEEMILKGVFCDGDIRRTIVNNQQTLSAFFVDDALDYGINNFKSVKEQTKLIDAIKLMGKFKIWDLPVIDSNKVLKGLLHLHPAVSFILRSEFQFKANKIHSNYE